MADKDAETGLIAALAAGKTIRDAAVETGISERTIFRRLEEPAFKQAVSTARGEMLARAVGQLADASTEAVQTLRELLKAEAETVRLGACRVLLEQANKLREATELEQRVTELEAKLTTQGGKKR